jgi:hypothetical protein
MGSVSDEAMGEDKRSSARGEAAWKEALERVAERNQAARKAGRQRRQAYEQQRADAHRAAETKRISNLITSRRVRP